MKTVTMTKAVRIPETAEDWELYTASMDCTEAAAALTKTLGTLLEAGADRAEVEEAMYRCMRLHADTGASDTEPYHILADTLDRIYGAEEDE